MQDENDSSENFNLTTDEDSLAMLNENLTQAEQNKLLAFFESIQDELLGMGDAGDVEINWDTREVHAFPDGATVPTKTWKLDDILKSTETLH